MKFVRSSAVLAAAALGTLGLSAAGGGVAAASSAAPSAGTATTTNRHINFLGVTNVGQLALTSAAPAASPKANGHELPPMGAGKPRSVSAAAVPVPNPPTTPVTLNSGGAQSFVGVTHLTQRLADNGNQFSLEPPDQGLCASGAVVVEAVNLGLQVFTEQRVALSPVIALNRFFHLPSAIDRSFTPPSFGPFVSDPRCYFDQQTARWFVTVLEIDINPLSGAFGFRSSQLIAVSQTSNPLGSYSIFQIDTTNDGSNGTPVEANCPCFGDQPRIGADANGFYISTDSFPIHGLFNSNGGEVYAVSKTGLAAAATGGPTPTLVAIHIGAITIDKFPANAVQPATTPAGGTYALNTEYFMSTPDFNGFATTGGAGAQAVVVWTLRGTSTLSSASPHLKLSLDKVASEPFAPPVNASQRPGPIPFGNLVHASSVSALSANDDRMQQVEYTGGHLFGSLNTGVGAAGTADRTAAAWFVVDPTGAGAVTAQGYVALAGGASTLYPAIGLTPAGTGAMAFSVSGPANFPSAAFIRFGPSGPSGPAHINGRGTAPEDGFTCYPPFGPSCRWGDYSAASSDGSGNIVMGTEMIPNTPRTTLANWGTFISTLRAS
jgi:hypothetical protein